MRDLYGGVEDGRVFLCLHIVRLLFGHSPLRFEPPLPLSEKPPVIEPYLLYMFFIVYKL